MVNNRGVFDALYMVALTLLMCGIVLSVYVHYQQVFSGSLVSPLAVLKTSDDLDIFEMREMELILDIAEDFGIDKEIFKDHFISGIDSNMKEFIFSDLYWNGALIEGNFDKTAFLENVLYSVDEDSDGIVLKRSVIGKKFFLEAEEKNSINFPVYFYLDYSAEYLIKKEGSKFVVEKI